MAVQLLERETALDEIREALAVASRGRGSALMIIGPAGIGKSELLHAVGRSSRRLRCLRAAAGEFEGELALGVVRQLFERALREAEAPEVERWMSGPASLVRPLLADGEPPRSGGPDGLALRHGLYWLAIQMAEDMPLALVVDDAHWADRESLAWLLYLTRRLEGLPIAVVLGSRPVVGDRTFDALVASPGTTVVRLTPLSPGGTAALVADRFGPDANPAFVSVAHELTGGNPFLTRELLLAADVGGVEPTRQGAIDLRGVTPDVVAGSVLTRVAAAGQDAQAVADAVAVLGEHSELRHLTAVADLEITSVSSAVEALVAGDVVVDGPVVRFAHPLLRAAVHGHLGDSRRALLHERAARSLAAAGSAADAVGSHVAASTPAGSDWAVDRLRDAASYALAAGSPGGAVGFLRRAAAEPPAEDMRLMILRELGSAQLRSGQAEGVQTLMHVHAETEDSLQRAALVDELMAPLFVSGEHQAASDLANDALAELGTTEPGLALMLESQAMLMTMLVGGTDAAERESQLLRRVEGASGAQPSERYAFSTLAAVGGIRGWPADRVRQFALLAIGDDDHYAHDLAVHRRPMFNALAAVAEVGDPGLALRRFEQAETSSRSRGSLILGVSGGRTWRAHLELQLGDLDSAEASARTVLELLEERPAPMYRPVATAALIIVAVERDQLDQAEAVLAETGLAGSLPATFPGAIAASARSRLRLEQGRVDQALDDAQFACRQAERLGVASYSTMPWREAQARARMRLGDLAAAAALAREELAAAENSDRPDRAAIARQVLGLSIGGSTGLAELERAVSVLAGTPRRLAHVQALFEFGASLRRAGERAVARERLRDAMEQAYRIGATRLQRIAEEELRLAGARPRKPVRHGVDALTPAELRASRLAADGLTTRQIAQTLFVSPKTVEAQLTAAYRKLDVHSREALRTALAEAPAA